MSWGLLAPQPPRRWRAWAGGRCLTGVDKTDWIPIDRATYDACVDPRDYRPRSPPRP